MEIAAAMNMSTPLAEMQVGSYEWERTPESMTLPIDDYLKVQVLQLGQVRASVKHFLADHCYRPRGIAFIAARGKLIAEFVGMAETKATFGEIVKRASSAVSHSDLRCIRCLDPRDLAKALCAAA